MKRIFALIMTFVLILCVFAGCTGSADKSTTATTTTTTATVTTTAANTSDNGSDVSPLMWRVTGKNGETLYLFGTIHVGDERSDAVMELISDTLGSCDALAVEFDIVAYQKDMAAMIADLEQYTYTDGTKTKDHLPEPLYSQAVEVMGEANLYNSFMEYYNVALWSQYVDQAALDLYCDLVADYGMDNMILNKAYADGMKILNVESGSFQMALLNSFSDELYMLLMESTISNIESYGTVTENLYSTWLSGDFDALTALLNQEDYTGLTDDQIALVKDYNYKLLDERNIGMGDKAVNYLRSGTTVFFAVGAAHMTGETGLVNRLSNEGYTVERVYFTQAD